MRDRELLERIERRTSVVYWYTLGKMLLGAFNLALLVQQAVRR